ncbi:unnamed protein product [Eretmochelys imbricata]
MHSRYPPFLCPPPNLLHHAPFFVNVSCFALHCISTCLLQGSSVSSEEAASLGHPSVRVAQPCRAGKLGKFILLFLSQSYFPSPHPQEIRGNQVSGRDPVVMAGTVRRTTRQDREAVTEGRKKKKSDIQEEHSGGAN